MQAVKQAVQQAAPRAFAKPSYIFRQAKPLYKGQVKSVILDWSGTTADQYVLAPAVVFVEVFKKFGVPISMQEARKPMGLRKDLHIQALTRIPEIAERWSKKHGRAPTQSDVDAMFKEFAPMQIACLNEYTGLLPGVVDTVKLMRKEFGVRIGMTTGFTRPMVDVLLRDAKKQGYEPDVNVAGDEVVHGARPGPFMVFRNLDLLGTYPVEAAVKVDDTVSGVGEGLNAGCWAVGVARWSNYMDIDSLDQERKLSKSEMQSRLDKSREVLRGSGAHYVVDDLNDLPPVLEEINQRLARGEKP